MLMAGEFFRTANERYRMLLRRDAGEPPPWTEDTFFQGYYYCNVFREDDKTTRWFRKALRDVHADDPLMSLRSTIVFRWFNRIETGKLMLPFLAGRYSWDTDDVRATLRHVKPLITGAYMITSPTGMSKLDGLLRYIDGYLESEHALLAKCVAAPTLEGIHKAIMSLPGLGNFLAYEATTDLRWTCLGRDATDIMTWATPGPGCFRGLGWVLKGDPTYYKGKRPRYLLPMMQDLLDRSRDQWAFPDRPWEMREVEHWLCEFDKYQRAVRGGRLKRKYPCK